MTLRLLLLALGWSCDWKRQWRNPRWRSFGRCLISKRKRWQRQTFERQWVEDEKRRRRVSTSQGLSWLRSRCVTLNEMGAESKDEVAHVVPNGDIITKL